MSRPTCPSLALLPCLIIMFALPVAATDFTVTRFDDPVPGACQPADCSLREAVIAANADSAADRIFLSDGFYSLTQPGTDEDSALTGDLDVTEDLDIIGRSGENILTLLDATGTDRVFDVRGLDTQVTLSRLWVVGGLESSGFAIRVLGGGTHLFLEDCQVSLNGSTGSGSAVSVLPGTQLTAERSTIGSNSGAGLRISTATAILRNSTVADNSNANTSRQINLFDATLTLTHATVTGSSSLDTAIALFENSMATIANSVVEGQCTNSSSTFNSLGGNYEAPGNTCDFTLPSDVNSAFTAGLEPLDDWGGPTWTRRPVSESPQIDNALEMNCLDVGQRGNERPIDGDQNGTAECDRGAVEFVVPIPIFGDGFESGSTSAWANVVP